MTAKIEIGTFTAPEKVNPYVETIDDLIATGNPDASVTLTVEVDNEGKERNLIAKAANSRDKTAKLRVRDDSKVKYGTDDEGNQVATGGTVALTFTLTKRHQARRGKGTQKPAEAAPAGE